MAYAERIRHRGVTNRDEVVDEPVATTDVTAERNYGYNVVSRVIWFVAGVILLLLAFRFVLSLLGANTTNGFAQFIYNTSHPFVAPFFGLFNYREQFGVSRFEVETIVAIVFWAMVTWFLTYLVSLGMRRRTMV